MSEREKDLLWYFKRTNARVGFFICYCGEYGRDNNGDEEKIFHFIFYFFLVFLFYFCIDKINKICFFFAFFFFFFFFIYAFFDYFNCDSLRKINMLSIY